MDDIVSHVMPPVTRQPAGPPLNVLQHLRTRNSLPVNIKTRKSKRFRPQSESDTSRPAVMPPGPAPSCLTPPLTSSQVSRVFFDLLVRRVRHAGLTHITTPSPSLTTLRTISPKTQSIRSTPPLDTRHWKTNRPLIRPSTRTSSRRTARPCLPACCGRLPSASFPHGPPHSPSPHSPGACTRGYATVACSFFSPKETRQ